MFDFPLFSSRTPPLLGLDISSTSVKLVELSANGKDGYRVERYIIDVLPQDAVSEGNIVDLDAVAEVVKRAWKRLGTSTRNVAMALPASAVITKKIIVPEGQREDELEALVEAEASQYIPFPLEEVNLDFQVLGPAAASPDEIEVLIAASRKEKVEDRIAVAETAGLKVLVMDVESFAAFSSFQFVQKQLPGEGKGRIIALVDLGGHAINVTVFKDGQQIYAREQAFGGNQLTQDIARHYGMNFAEAESAKRADNLPDTYEAELLRPFIESTALEVARALQFFFTSTQFNEVHQIVLSGGCAQISDVDEIVATRTQVDTIIANPFADMLLSDRVRAQQLLADAPSLLVACGLALRRFDE